MLRLVKIELENEEIEYYNEDQIIRMYDGGDNDFYVNISDYDSLEITKKCYEMLKKKFCKSLDFKREES